MGNKRRFGKTWYFFYLKLTTLDVWRMPDDFITNWITPRSLRPSKELKKC